MHDDLTQPHSPPRDATQRMLRLVLNGLGFALPVLAPLTFIAALIAGFALPTTTTGDYLILVFCGLVALFFLRIAIVGVVLARAPRRISPKILASVARFTSQPQRMGQLYVWAGTWLATYFVVAIAVFHQPPLPRTITPSLVTWMVALPIVLIIAFGPVRIHRVRERRRASATRRAMNQI